MADLTIRDIRCFLTRNLVVVKVETNEPELYGLGCATFTYRGTAIAAVVNDYLKPFLTGKDPSQIEDIWQSCMVAAYWRNGPILNNALSGVDMALWDIKGKVAGMPLYELFGGKTREAAAVYLVPGGRDLEEFADNLNQMVEQGCRHFKLNGLQRILEPQMSRHAPITVTRKVPTVDPKSGLQQKHVGRIEDPRRLVRVIEAAFDTFRTRFGPELNVLYDVHERLPPMDGVALAKRLEKYDLYFIEDLLAPEDNEYHRILRQQVSVPIAMGELYNHPHEIVPMIQDRLLDFLRLHISQVGGLTPARKLTSLCEPFGVRTAWHGPGDVSPVGHAANLMLDLHAWNFGIQEAAPLYNPDSVLCDMFPGIPQVRDGYMWSNDRPGLGIDFDEKLAAKHPTPKPDAATMGYMSNIRLPDGTVIRP
jgi:mannonate dehydratase